MDETTTAAVPRASFLEIPTEIRCIILKNLFRNAMVFIRERVDDRDGIHKDNRSFYIKISAGYCRSVLQSCKQLNEEASKVLESSLTLNCDGALLHRVLSTPPVMRYAKHIRHIEFIGLPDIGPECFDAFTNLRVLKIDEAWKARVNDMLPYAEDEKDVKKQLEGSCDEELKQKWKKRLLKSDSFRKTMEHANRKFKIRYRGYAEADGPSQEADETKYQSLVSSVPPQGSP